MDYRFNGAYDGKAVMGGLSRIPASLLGAMQHDCDDRYCGALDGFFFFGERDEEVDARLHTLSGSIHCAGRRAIIRLVGFEPHGEGQTRTGMNIVRDYFVLEGEGPEFTGRFEGAGYRLRDTQDLRRLHRYTTEQLLRENIVIPHSPISGTIEHLVRPGTK